MGCTQCRSVDAQTIQRHNKKKNPDKVEAELSSISKIAVCVHKYLNKWEGVYVCMDCQYHLSSSIAIDAARIKKEEDLEKNTGYGMENTDTCFFGLCPISEDTKKSNLGKMSQMRGVTIEFLVAFTKKYKCWKWSSWQIIRKIIKPATKSKRCRYVELDWMAEHVGPAKTFISYAQAGKWGDLVAGILDGGADLKRIVWIDIFAIRQWPSDTPDLDFANTIEYCESFLCVCSYLKSVEDMSQDDVRSNKTELIPIEDRKQIAFLRVWCLVEIAAAAKQYGFPIIMKCGRHVVNSDGSVKFESKAELLGNLSYLVDIKKAEATVASDKTRILGEIEAGIGIDKLNSIVRGVLDGATGIAHFGGLGSTVQCAACGDKKAIDEVLYNRVRSIYAVAAGGYMNLLAKVVSKATDINVKSRDGVSPLMYASHLGHANCMKLLIEKGCDVNIKDHGGKTALMYASQGGHVTCMEMLLNHGADVDAKNNSLKTALTYANGNVSAMDLLKTRGAKDASGTRSPSDKSIRHHSVTLFPNEGSSKSTDSIKLFKSTSNKKLASATIDESPESWKMRQRSSSSSSSKEESYDQYRKERHNSVNIFPNPNGIDEIASESTDSVKSFGNASNKKLFFAIIDESPESWRMKRHNSGIVEDGDYDQRGREQDGDVILNFPPMSPGSLQSYSLQETASDVSSR